MHSISDLTTFCRKTSGDVPAKLVGASTTVVGSKMYLFGGRLVTERRMVSDLYVFDLETFVWEKLTPFSEDDVPEPRYFHSAETWNNQLIIFGGMSNTPNPSNPEDLCVLNDIRFLDLSTMHWLPASSTNGTSLDTSAEALVPKPRYAHLTSVTADRLFIIGGQDLSNIWLDDVYVYDLLGKAWVQRRNFPHHCGTYRSVAVSANLRVRLPQEELRATDDTAILGSPGSRFRSDKLSPSSQEFTPTESLIHLPYSAAPTDDFPNDIYLYSNYNFTDVKRELEVFSPLPDTDFTITDRSTTMTGTSFPPGLRFPSGAILGNHFIIAGTYLAHTYQSYSIWALDLLTMTWSRIDPGNAVASGSWFRACLWAEASKFVIFGNRNGNLVEDYNRRLLSWDHVAVIDLESFGIYQPPALQLDIPMQEFGLSALEESVLADFELVCDDGRKIKCSRKTLEDRWPWFKDQRVQFLERARQAIEIMPSSSMDVGLPDLPGAPDLSESRPDPRLTPRAFNLSEPYPITLALMQYFYSLALITPLQHAPAVLSQLLILSSTYQITHLECLVKHAMHRALSNSTSVGVYEVATLCSCRSLQIRALKTVMSYSQKRTGRSRADSKGGSGGNRNPDPGDSDHQGRGSDETLGSSAARTRGASDAKFPTVDQQNGGGSTSRGYVANHTVPTHDGASYQISATTATTSISQINGHSHKATLSECTLTPPRRTRVMSSHTRALSIVSAHTDFELCAVAELISPSVSHVRSLAEEQETIGVALDDDFDNYLDASIRPSIQRPGKVTTSPYLLLEHEEPLSPSHPSYLPSDYSSTPSDSEHEQSSEDNHYHSHTPSNPSFPAFHLPRRARARTRSSAGISTSDSDTPSLSSSTTSFSSLHSQSYSGSPPISPATLKTPVDHAPLSYNLTIIEERPTEDQEANGRRLSQSSGSIIFAPTGVSPAEDKFLLMPKAPETRLRNRNVEHLRVYVPPPSTRFPIISPSPASTIEFAPTASTFTLVASPRPSGKLSLNRIISPASKISNFAGSKVERQSSSPTASVLTSKTSRKEEAKEEKLHKAEAKRMKKAEQKAKVERLAEELKERQRRKTLALDKQSVHSNRSVGRGGRRQWDSDIAMYDGLGGAF
ncbi:galactose oxidase [Gyrodon lividus]|nr:galactose oxidase [Gyrodon lividus]